MTEHEVLELMAMHVGQVDTTIQFWLTISFGVLVAVHIAGSTIIHQLEFLLCFLCVSATLIFVFHTSGDLVQAAIYNLQLGKESPAQVWNMLGAVLRANVYFLGTLSVSVAIFRHDSWMRKKMKPDKSRQQ